MNKIIMRVAVAVPLTDEELYDMCVRSNEEGELDQIGTGYYDVNLTLDEVKSLATREGSEFVDDGYLFVAGDDLEKSL